MIINFLGTIVAPYLLSRFDSAALDQMSAAELGEATLSGILPGLIGFAVYALLMIGASTAGLILLLKRAPG